MNQTKVCTICNVEKELTEFNEQSGGKTYRNECKACWKVKNRVYYIQNKGKMLM